MSILVRINGGLGNQMFQYALYIALKKMGKRVRLDRIGTLLHREHYFGSQLHDAFKLPEHSPLMSSLLWRGAYWIWKKNEIVKKFYPRDIYDEPKDQINYHPEIIEIKHGYLRGFWQSERYFHEASDDVRERFIFREEHNPKNLELVKMINSVNSVSIHFRLGDYTKPDIANIFGNICTEQYYVSAMNYIDAHISNPMYFIFTNDVDYVTRLGMLHNRKYLIVDWNKDKQDFRDMQLMSYCKHNIIANSTFSWWGAWLNTNSRKLIIAPSKWSNRVDCFEDILPIDWIKIGASGLDFSK